MNLDKRVTVVLQILAALLLLPICILIGEPYLTLIGLFVGFLTPVSYCVSCALSKNAKKDEENAYWEKDEEDKLPPTEIVLKNI